MKKLTMKAFVEYEQKMLEQGLQVYLDDKVPDSRFVGYKYFIKYCKTNVVHVAAKTQNDIIRFCIKAVKGEWDSSFDKGVWYRG